MQKWDIPFSVWGAVPSTTPAVLFTPFWKPPKNFSAYAPARHRLRIHTLPTENPRRRLRIHTLSTEDPRHRLRIQDVVTHGILVMPEKPLLVSKLILTKLKVRPTAQMQHSLQHNGYSNISTRPCKTLENVTVVDIVDNMELQEHPG